MRFVVFVGFLILSGAVNTSIVGSNGVLSRVAEDGVLPDWFLKPHRRYGTNYRVAVSDYRLATVHDFREPRRRDPAGRSVRVWRGVELRVQHLSMVVLRFKDHAPREFSVPFNIRWGKTLCADRFEHCVSDHVAVGASRTS